MSEWKEYSLINIADIYDEKRVPLSKMQREHRKGKYPYYGASGIIDYIDDYLFDGEYVLISEDGENLKTRQTPIAFKVKGKFWVNNHAHIIKGKEIYINDLLVYFFRNLDLHPFLTGAVQPKLNQENLLSIPIILPNSESEQRAIASVLSSLDDKIDLLHRQNKTLESMAETLFRQWFVEEVDEKWEEGKLGNYIQVIDNRGKTPPFSEIETNFPIIEVNALTEKDRLINYSAIKKYVTEDIYKNWFRAGHPQKYDTLIATVGSVGEMAMFLNNKGTIAQNIVGFRATKTSPFYLYQYLKYIENDIKEYDIGSVQPSIKVTHLIKMDFIQPDPKTLNEFDNRMTHVVDKLMLNQVQIFTLEKLRDTLLPKLMSGEVRVEI